MIWNFHCKINALTKKIILKNKGFNNCFFIIHFFKFFSGSVMSTWWHISGCTAKSKTKPLHLFMDSDLWSIMNGWTCFLPLNSRNSFLGTIETLTSMTCGKKVLFFSLFYLEQWFLNKLLTFNNQRWKYQSSDELFNFCKSQSSDMFVYVSVATLNIMEAIITTTVLSTGSGTLWSMTLMSMNAVYS